MRVLSLVLSLVAAPVAAHELWIEPLDYQIAADGTLQADIVNGETFEGSRLPYLGQRITRFEVFAGGASAPVEGRMGDRPALNRPALAPGLNVVVYEAAAATVTYATLAKFESFVTHKDLGPAIARHLARGLPLTEFKEVYSRQSKTLIAAGDGAGADLVTGMETEIVALANPYTDPLPDGLPVRVLYQGAPRGDVQVEVFEKAPDGQVAVSFHRTDADGVARVPVRPGHAYQVDAVVLREPAADLAARHGAVWETLWANLTFAVPG